MSKPAKTRKILSYVAAAVLIPAGVAGAFAFGSSAPALSTPSDAAMPTAGSTATTSYEPSLENQSIADLAARLQQTLPNDFIRVERDQSNVNNVRFVVRDSGLVEAREIVGGRYEVRAGEGMTRPEVSDYRWRIMEKMVEAGIVFSSLEISVDGDTLAAAIIGKLDERATKVSKSEVQGLIRQLVRDAVRSHQVAGEPGIGNARAAGIAAASTIDLDTDNRITTSQRGGPKG